MSAAHTPGPWRVVRANPSPTTGEFMIAGAKPGYLAEVRDCGTGDVAANARRIVQCVNSHDALVEALREVLSRIVPGSLASDVRQRAEEALRAATGEAAS